MSACPPACVRFMQIPLFTMNCRRRTAEAEEAAESSTRRVGISLTRGFVVVVSKREQPQLWLDDVRSFFRNLP